MHVLFVLNFILVIHVIKKLHASNQIKAFKKASCVIISIPIFFGSNISNAESLQDGFASVYIYRNQNVASSFESKISVNDVIVASLTGKTFAILKLIPGSYDIALMHLKNSKINISVSANKDYYIQNETKIFGGDTLLTPGGLLKLISNDEGMAEVKGLKLTYEVCLGDPITFKNPEGSIWEGEFDLGKPNGTGKLKYTNGDVYEGLYHEGKPNGEGVFYQSNGAMAGGFFKDGLINGQGYIKTANEHEYTGEMVNHRPQGDGELITPDGFFSGKFKDGKFITGKVFMKDSGGVLYENGKSIQQASTQSNSTTNTTIQNILNVSIKMLAAVVSGYSQSAEASRRKNNALFNEEVLLQETMSRNRSISNTAHESDFSIPSSTLKQSNTFNNTKTVIPTEDKCTSDFQCGVGNVCIKQRLSNDGVCMKSVDSNGVRVYNTPSSGSIGVRTSEGCQFNTDCPVGFSCDEVYKACVRK